MLKRLREPQERFNAFDAFIGNNDAECPHCHWTDTVSKIALCAFNRGGLLVIDMKCPSCEREWRRVDCTKVPTV